MTDAAARPPGFADLAAAFRAGRRTPTDVVDATLAAIAASDRSDPPLRAVLTVTAERARR